MDRQQIGLNQSETKNEKTKRVVQTVGEVLRQTRESKGYSLRDISQTLRISERYLQALEKEDHDSLPEPVYTLGFLRNYAFYLSLDPTPLIAKFQADLNIQNKQSALHFKQATPENQIPAKPIVFASAILAVILIAGWGYYKIDQSLEKNAIPSHTLVPDEKVSTSGSSQYAVTDANVRSSNTATQGENLDQTLEQGQSVFAEDILLEKPHEQLAENNNKQINEVPKVLLADFRVAPGQTLTIKADRRSWVEMRTKDGRILLSRILKEGEDRQIKVQSGLVFSTGNAGGVTFSTQMQQTMPLGAEGQVLRDIELQIATSPEDSENTLQRANTHKIEEKKQQFAQVDYQRQ